MFSRTGSTSPDDPAFTLTNKYEADLALQPANASVFGRTSNLYVTDRCFVPRRLCKLRLRSSATIPRGAQLILPREGPGQTHLFPGKFDVALGAAQVVGVLTRSSFVAQLEAARGGLPVVNLGRGAAGPHVYTDAATWPLVAPLLTNARSVIICVMAGRSSPSSESGAFSGQVFGAEQLRAYDRVVALERQGKRNHARRLVGESLRAAASDYVELVRRIRSGGRDGHRPRVLLVWFSSCPLAGCTQLWMFPQYYLAPSTLPSLAATLDVELVDASYATLPPSPPLKIDQCASCQPRGTAVCSSVSARQDGLATGRLCGGYCGAVLDAYYPDDNAHSHAFRLLAKVLASPRARSSFFSEAAADDDSDTGALGARARTLPAIGVGGSSKLFFHHVHKAAGTAFLAYLSGLEGVLDCASAGVTHGDHTRPSSWAAFSRWWLATAPSCNLASIESPHLGEMLSKLASGATSRAVLEPPAPQILSFIRHPVARCRSHFRYEHALCRRQPLGMHQSYCVRVFLPRFGGAALNSSASHAAFADEYCTEQTSRSLTAANGIPSARQFLLQRVAFFGLTEHFLPSLCLFLHQAGRFRRDLCTCPPGGGPLRIERELPTTDPTEAELLRQGAIGVPPLRVSDESLLRRSPKDAELYRLGLRVLRLRVRALETRLNASIWECRRDGGVRGIVLGG
jgi:hypothetical protein